MGGWEIQFGHILFPDVWPVFVFVFVMSFHLTCGRFLTLLLLHVFVRQSMPGSSCLFLFNFIHLCHGVRLHTSITLFYLTVCGHNSATYFSHLYNIAIHVKNPHQTEPVGDSHDLDPPGSGPWTASTAERKTKKK